MGLVFLSFESGKKKELEPKLCGPDIFGWAGGLPREGARAEKFGMSFKTQGNQTFWRDIPAFLPGYSGVPEKFERKSLCSILVPYPIAAVSIRSAIDSDLKSQTALQNRSRIASKAIVK